MDYIYIQTLTCHKKPNKYVQRFQRGLSDCKQTGTHVVFNEQMALTVVHACVLLQYLFKSSSIIFVTN